MKHRLILVLALSAGVISLVGTLFVSASRRAVAVPSTLSGRDKVAHPSDGGERFCASQIRNASAQGTLARQETVAGQSATLLPDGRILAVGGEGHGGPVAEIRDPKTSKTITLAKGLQRSRAWHSATLLPDGNVLILGGEDDQRQLIEAAELFNAVTQEFESLSITGLTPRVRHTATVLMDGRVLIAGGNAGPLELLDLKTRSAVALQATLITAREKHSADLMADGNVLLWGGGDQDGNKIEGGEIFDSETQSVSLAGEHARHPDARPPYMTASLPQDGEMSVAEDVRIAVRFSKALRVESLNEHTVVLSGPRGKVAAKVIPAEVGRLLFVTPSAKLELDSSYHLVIDGAADPDGEKLGFSAVNFKTKGHSHRNEEPRGNGLPIIDHDSWIPEARNLNGDWSSGRPDASSRSLPARTAAPGETALAGQVLTLSGQPLANVTMQIGERVALTDQTGRFLLSGLSAGRFDLTIQGETASRPGKRYATFDVLVDIASGKTNVLPYTIWLPVLDDQNKKALSIPTQRETVVTTPRVPGMEVRVPASSVLRMPAGAHHKHGQMERELSSMAITPIPVDRPPFPLPEGVKDGLLFTLQLHGARVEGLNGEKRPGMRIIFPNYQNLPAGDRVDFWNYDPAGVGWYLYGHGTVTPDRKQVVPDPGVELQSMYCISLMNKGDAPGTGPNPCDVARDGDPVHLDTGLFVYEETDLQLPDIIPLELTRSYRPNDPVQRSFGRGGNNPYDMYVFGDTYNYGEIILPNGGRVRFDKIPNSSPAVYEHTSTPTRFYKATMTMITGVGPNGAWEVRLKDGTLFQFGIKVLYGDIFGPHVSITGLSVVQDRLGNKVIVNRDNDFRMSRVTSPNGRWIQFGYSDTSKRIAQATDSAGRTVSYLYDASGRLWKVTDAKGGITEFSYDASDRMTTIKDPKNVVFLTNEYDANGRVSRQTLADTGVYQFAYTLDANNKITQAEVTDPRGKVRRVNFNSSGQPTAEILALGTPEQQNYAYERQAGSNLLLSITDSLGRKTALSYDSLGNVTGITKLADTPNAVTASVTHDPTFGQITSITDFLSHTKSFAYDSSGRLVTVTDALNNQTTYTYNSAGQLLTATNPLQQTTTFTYDGADLVAITDAAGRTITRYLDSAGRVARHTNALGSVSRYEYNNRDQLVRITDPMAGVTAVDRDPNGNLLNLTDARNNVTSYTFDNMDRLITTRDPLSHDETYQYDLKGNLKQLTDRKGQIRNLSYDALNRLTQITYADSSTTTYTYDAGNRLTQIVDSLSGTITYTYDDLDRVTSETTPQGSVSYTHDAAGRRTSMTVAGQPTVNYSYDNANRLTQITQGSSTVTFGYDAAGRRTSLTLPNGLVTEYAYNPASQLISLTYKQGATTLGDLTFEYDANGRRTRIGGSFARSVSPQALSLASYNAANQQVSFGGQTLAYDLNGNLLSDGVNSYTWDARNRLVAMSGPNLNASFQYDAVGRRISKTINGVTTSFGYDGVNVVQEQSAQLGNANMLNGGIDEVLMRTDSAGTWSHLRDGLGSTLAVTDASGVIQSEYSYGAFGQTAAGGDNNSAQYTGRENDGTGLYYYRARYYSPSLQRFISEDPIKFAGGDVNIYAYVSNDPINYTDPSGLEKAMKKIDELDDPTAGGVINRIRSIGGSSGVKAWLRAPRTNGPSSAITVGSTRAQSIQQAAHMSASSGTALHTGTAPRPALQVFRSGPPGASGPILDTGTKLLELGPELYNTLKIIDCRNQKINEVLRHLGQ